MNDTLAGLRDTDDLLRIQLQFDADQPELAAWPWEYLFIPQDKDHEFGGQFLATQAQLVLSRRLEVNTKNLPCLLTGERVRVLLVCSAPLNAGVFFETVLEKARKLHEDEAIELIPLVDEPRLAEPLNRTPNVMWENFTNLVKNKEPHVIHFIGHGKLEHRQSKLAFVKSDGHADWKVGELFAEKAVESKSLKLVFLQACESALFDPHAPMADVARLCAAKNIPAVVAMQAKIENSVASEFACQFYDALAQGRPVDYAVLQGRRAIRDKLKMDSNAPAFGVPVLYLRSFDSLFAPTKSGSGITRTSTPGEKTIFYCPYCWEPAFATKQEFCVECAKPLRCPSCDQFFETKRANGVPLSICYKCGQPMKRETASGSPMDVSKFGPQRQTSLPAPTVPPGQLARPDPLVP